MRPALLALVVLLLPIPLAACLWDEDTLRAESRGMPDVVRIITGRFERNPPLYYELRLKRSEARIKENPGDLDAYDDAGVASDRLGRDDEAIAFMERKREQMERMTQSGGDRRRFLGDRYRYLANVGTFWVHRWARSGADRARIAEVKTARDFIAQAIALNPDAHFGREGFQLKALERLITPPAPRGPDFTTLPPLLDLRDPANTDDAAVRGLAGLIALGNAWESVDIFNTLAQVLERDGQRSSVSMMARMRCDELIDAGRRSLLPGAPTDAVALKDKVAASANGGVTGGSRANVAVRSAYNMLRREAEDWHQSRTRYMMARLERGSHPDTDPTFWKDYTEPAPPPIPATYAAGRSPREKLLARIATTLALLVGAALLIGATVAVTLWRLRGARKPVLTALRDLGDV